MLTQGLRAQIHSIIIFFVPLQLDQHQRGVRRDRQQVDDPAEASLLLPPDQHPLRGQDLRPRRDHFLEFLLGGELRQAQGLGTRPDFPDGVVDGHGSEAFHMFDHIGHLADLSPFRCPSVMQPVEEFGVILRFGTDVTKFG